MTNNGQEAGSSKVMVQVVGDGGGVLSVATRGGTTKIGTVGMDIALTIESTKDRVDSI